MRTLIRTPSAHLLGCLLLSILQAAVGWAGGAEDDCGDGPLLGPCLISEAQISVRIFIPGNIEEPGDVDVYSFEVLSDHVGFLYLLETVIPTGDPFSDTYIRLIDRDGLTEIASDNDSGAGLGSRILWSPSAAGTYHLEVSQFLPGEIGLFQISVFRSGPAPDDDHGDDPLTGTLLTVGGLPIACSTELSADVDFFKFAVEPNQFYDIETSGLESGSDTVITLYDSDGETLLAIDDQGGRQFNASRILWISPNEELETEVLAFIRVQQFLPGKSGVGYSIAVSSPGQPATLPLEGEEIVGEIEEPGSAAAFLFEASANTQIEVGLSVSPGELNLFEIRLLDSDGVSLLKSLNSLEFEKLNHTFTRTDDYYLLVTEPYTGGLFTLTAQLTALEGNPDLNLDGKIDAQDFLILMEAYSTGP